jgi:hypothetical protein
VLQLYANHIAQHLPAVVAVDYLDFGNTFVGASQQLLQLAFRVLCSQSVNIYFNDLILTL